MSAAVWENSQRAISSSFTSRHFRIWHRTHSTKSGWNHLVNNNFSMETMFRNPVWDELLKTHRNTKELSCIQWMICHLALVSAHDQQPNAKQPIHSAQCASIRQTSVNTFAVKKHYFKQNHKSIAFSFSVSNVLLNNFHINISPWCFLATFLISMQYQSKLRSTYMSKNVGIVFSFRRSTIWKKKILACGLHWKYIVVFFKYEKQ